MTKHDTTLLFITYTGTYAGTAMTKAIKEFARNEFEETIIDEFQRTELVMKLQKKVDELAAANPKWKRSVVSLHDNTCGGAFLHPATVYWLRVDGETILTMKKAKCNYATY